MFFIATGAHATMRSQDYLAFTGTGWLALHSQPAQDRGYESCQIKGSGRRSRESPEPRIRQSRIVAASKRHEACF
jgi:hypothetical protein